MTKKDEIIGKIEREHLSNKEQFFPPQTPLDHINNALNALKNSIQEQQLSAEKSIQSSLSQASTYVSNSQNLKTLSNLVQQFMSFVSQGSVQAVNNNLQQIKQVHQQLDTQVQQQRAKADSMVIQSMQEAVSAMAQAQEAMLLSGAYAKMGDELKIANQNLQQLQPPSQSVQ